jgi:hypothetical protein
VNTLAAWLFTMINSNLKGRKTFRNIFARIVTFICTYRLSFSIDYGIISFSADRASIFGASKIHCQGIAEAQATYYVFICKKMARIQGQTERQVQPIKDQSGRCV